MLSPARVTDLIVRWQRDRDEAARQELVREFLPLAKRLARRYLHMGEPLDDLVQVASVGLLGAIERFDTTRGSGFPAFAIPTILGELKRYFRTNSWSAHVPRRAQETALRIDRAVNQLSATTGRTPSAKQLAEFLEISLEEVLVGLDASQARHALSLDAPTPGSEPDDGADIADQIGHTDDRFDLVDIKLSLAECLPRLPEKERRALMLRVDCDLKQSEVAALMGCSQMQVSRLLHSAANRVREFTAPSDVVVAATQGSR